MMFNMQLTNCEYTLDKAKVIFMYTSDDRVDFREPIKGISCCFQMQNRVKTNWSKR